MPEGAAVSKLSAVAAFGATVHQQGESVDEAIELARARADEAGFTFVHPFDDDDVIAGQAGVGIELLEQVPDLGSVVVPIGGGGLAAGVALAIKSERPDVTIIGVQADACAPYIESLRCGEAVTATALPTIADGIAVKRPGGRTLELIQRLVDDVVTVSEEEIADAMVLLMERSKLVVEGAGAASLAALMAGRAKPAATGTTVAILSGGNVDTGLLALLASRSETRAGRRLRLFTTVSDRPGGLASMLSIVAADGASVISLEHVREGVELAVRRTGVELVLETRGRDHARAVVDRLTDRGYEVRAEE
jgi:threonine dehydratase